MPGMKIQLLLIGKTDKAYIEEGINEYLGRLRHYADTEIIIAPVKKQWSKLPVQERKEKEAEVILKHIMQSDRCILLDEKGKSLNSGGFANLLGQIMSGPYKKLLFVVGGPWGFSPEVYRKAHMKLSLSAMTFSHQVIRIIFLEQLYRAMTIIRGEPYHNQ